MKDNDTGEGLSTRILRRSGVPARPFLIEDKGVDIEKLVSLLAASGVAKHTDLAEKMRRLYFDEVRRGLTAARVMSAPQLSIGLLEMHKDMPFRRNVETLTGILTTNHDGLLQIAFRLFVEVSG